MHNSEITDDTLFNESTLNIQYYLETIIRDDSYRNTRGQAEKICQQQWADKNLDFWFANRKVPFNKPLFEIARRFQEVTWAGVLYQLATEQESYRLFRPPKICPICNRPTIARKFNFTEIVGCSDYANGKCSYGKTYYHKEVFTRIGMIDRHVDCELKDKLINELRESGPNGLPDIIGIKGNILYFVEIKDICEKLSWEQIHWLNWLGEFNGKGISIVMRVTNKESNSALQGALRDKAAQRP